MKSTLSFSQEKKINSVGKGSFPTLLNSYSGETWANSEFHDSDEVKELIDQLKKYLGKFGFQWFAACSVYPSLDWNFTVLLGASLADHKGLERPDEAFHLAMTRLPWFRYGRFPEYLRKILIRELKPENEEIVRSTLNNILLTILEPSHQNYFELDIAKGPPRKKVKKVSQFLDHEPSSSKNGDHIFVKFMMDDQPKETDFPLPKALNKIFKKNKWLKFDLPIFAGFISTLFLAMVMTFFENPIQNGLVSILKALEGEIVGKLFLMGSMLCLLISFVGLVDWTLRAFLEKENTFISKNSIEIGEWKTQLHLLILGISLVATIFTLLFFMMLKIEGANIFNQKDSLLFAVNVLSLLFVEGAVFYLQIKIDPLTIFHGVKFGKYDKLPPLLDSLETDFEYEELFGKVALGFSVFIILTMLLKRFLVAESFNLIEQKLILIIVPSLDTGLLFLLFFFLFASRLNCSASSTFKLFLAVVSGVLFYFSFFNNFENFLAPNNPILLTRKLLDFPAIMFCAIFGLSIGFAEFGILPFRDGIKFGFLILLLSSAVNIISGAAEMIFTVVIGGCGLRICSRYLVVPVAEIVKFSLKFCLIFFVGLALFQYIEVEYKGGLFLISSVLDSSYLPIYLGSSFIEYSSLMWFFLSALKAAKLKTKEIRNLNLGPEFLNESEMKGESNLRAFILTLITAGIYVPIWFIRYESVVRSLDKSFALSGGRKTFIAFSVLFGFAEVSIILDRLGFNIFLKSEFLGFSLLFFFMGLFVFMITALKVRDSLQKSDRIFSGTPNFFTSVKVIIFNLFYLNSKLNKALEKYSIGQWPIEKNEKEEKKRTSFFIYFIVIAVIGILAAIAIPQFSQYKERAYNSNAKADLHNIYLACKAFWADNLSTTPCTIQVIKKSMYGYTKGTDVSVEIRVPTESNFVAWSKHDSSGKAYLMNEAGFITEE